jgi:hypothetical protein
MDIGREAGDPAKLKEFIKNKRPEETVRDAVVRFYIGMGENQHVTSTRDVGVIVDGVKMGLVDCALASPASLAVVYADNRGDALLGLWELAELCPRIGLLVIGASDPSVAPETARIARKSYLLKSSSVRFVIMDLESSKVETIMRNGVPRGRRKIIRGRRQPYKKQD